MEYRAIVGSSMKSHLFLAGVPATGKTSLGKWLRKHGYIHLDAERNDGTDFDHFAIHDAWNDLYDTGRADGFLAAIESLDKPVVIDWGFPPDALYIVNALRTVGVAVWWIDGDRQHAKAAFEYRYQNHEGPSPEAFDPQMDRIEKHWLLIEYVFAGHIVSGLNPDGTQRRPSEMWNDMKDVHRSPSP